MSDTSHTSQQLQEVFRNTFNDDEIVLNNNMTAADVDGWDSLAHINLIIAVEKQFGVRFATAEISGLKGEGQNIGTFVALLDKKIAAKK